MAIFLVHFLFLLHLAGVQPAAMQDECAPASCGDSGTVIRFPFRLKDRQPDYCGFPGFDLSCSKSNTTEFELRLPVKSPTKNILFPVSVKVSIQEINYTSQVMKISALNASCLPKELHSVNYSVFTFEIAEEVTLYTLFNCPSSYTQKYPDLGNKVTCLRDHGYHVVGFPSLYGISDLPLSSCTKMYDISNFPLEVFNGLSEYNETFVRWSRPSCASCEARGKYCKLKNNDTRQEAQCFDIPKQLQEPGHRKGVSKSAVIICAALGVLFMVMVGIVSGTISFKRKKEYQKKFELLLEDYKAFRITSFSYADIKRITNQFREKLGEGSFGRLYKGKLPNEVSVAVKVLNNFRGNAEEFISEVRRMGSIRHANVISLVGYCADGNRRALVYEFLTNDSLQKIVASENQIPSLGCKKWQEIAIGIAKGIDHIHQGSNRQILHLDIRPQNILLDENYNPQITDIGLARLSSKEWDVDSLIASQGMTDYVAPEVLSRNFQNASDKSDVYSFGMLLFDLVGRRKRNHAETGKSSQIYFPEWMYSQLTLGEDADIQIDRDESSKISKKLILIGLWCTQWYPEDRPDMDVVIQMLEGENMPIMPPNPFLSRRSEQPNTTEL